MKIAILSMQKVYNYGSVLQAYSLKEILEEITNERIDFLNPILEEKIKTNMKVTDSNDYVDKPFIENKILFFIKKAMNKIKFRKFKKEIEQFQNKYLHLSDENVNKMYDLVIEGSDEVFKCSKEIYLNMYGAVENTKHLISYAASCGSADIDGLPVETISILKEKMKRFEDMSVRDKHTKEYISNLYDGKIEQHLDPVLVGNLKNMEHKKVKHKDYMIVYAYGDRIHTKEEIQAIKNYAKKYKLKIISIGAPQYWCDEFVVVSPLEVLDYFYYAKCAVTDTFHGTIFSIINGCKFATILRKTNENKLGNLLSQLELSNHHITNMNDLENILNCKVDYNKVEEILNIESKKTREYLKKNYERWRK